MTHLEAEDDRYMPLLAARAHEYERLAGRFAGLLARCGRPYNLLVERLAACQPMQQRLTAGPPAR